MKATELRIGNQVYFGNTRHSITGRDIYKLQDGACFDEKPIKLNEEWLLKFGFKKKIELSALASWNNGCIELIQSGSGYDVFLNDFDDRYASVQKIIEFVHQLQNLYFALTEEELEIK